MAERICWSRSLFGPRLTISCLVHPPLDAPIILGAAALIVKLDALECVRYNRLDLCPSAERVCHSEARSASRNLLSYEPGGGRFLAPLGMTRAFLRSQGFSPVPPYRFVRVAGGRNNRCRGFSTRSR